MADKKIVEYVAELARIEVTEKEKESLGKQIVQILDYIDKLKELDVEGVAPMRGLHQERNVFRADKVVSFPFREDILQNSPLREGDYFKVPKVIE